MRFRYISALPFEQRPLGIVAEEVETMDAKRKQDDCQKPVEILASKMEALGYVADWSVVNALDFGLPQSRARCWMVFLKVHDHHLGTQDQRRRDANNVIADAKSMQLDQYEPWEEVFAGVAKAWPERITPAVSMDDPKGTELVDKNVRTKAKTRWPDRRALTSGCACVWSSCMAPRVARASGGSSVSLSPSPDLRFCLDGTTQSPCIPDPCAYV